MRSRRSWTIVAAIVTAASVLAFAVLSPNAVRGASAANDVWAKPTRLYYQDGSWLWSVTLGANRTKKRLARVVAEGSGLAVTTRYIFWMSLTERNGLGEQSLYRFRRDGTHRVRLVGNVDSPSGIVAVGRRVYWIDGRAIGRVNDDGGGVRRKLVVPPQEYGGGVGSGLTSDGSYLYFIHGRGIARVRLNGSGLNLRYIYLGDKRGPQPVAYADGYLYWGDVDRNFTGILGRASLDRRVIEPEWLHVGKPPIEMAAGRGLLFWTHGAGANSPYYAGLASSRGKIISWRYLSGSPVALGP